MEVTKLSRKVPAVRIGSHTILLPRVGREYEGIEIHKNGLFVFSCNMDEALLLIKALEQLLCIALPERDTLIKLERFEDLVKLENKALKTPRGKKTKIEVIERLTLAINNEFRLENNINLMRACFDRSLSGNVPDDIIATFKESYEKALKTAQEIVITQ